SQFYPSKLGDGFIEVHHLAPLFIDDQPRRTTMSDLLLLCSNCHRMVHRSKDVDENLQVLRDHFEQQTANKAVDSTATRVTPPASSLRSGQESRHGQP
ncbi:MAG: HNH endonuclease, partial [Candidatus Limnocylindrus sp.]